MNWAEAFFGSTVVVSIAFIIKSLLDFASGGCK